jgi:hypothetical protein
MKMGDAPKGWAELVGGNGAYTFHVPSGTRADFGTN